MKNILLFTALVFASTILNTISAQEGIGISNSSISTEVPPMYIIDGKEVDSFKIEDIKPDDIESMSVLKGDDAINKYGAKGKNGVIIIITKNAPLEITSKPKSEIKLNSKGRGIPSPLYILDGLEISKLEMKKIDPDSIEKMSVLKGDKAIDKYGAKGKNGVIEIFSKK